MTHPIISVQNLSKAYRLGLKEQAPDTLMGAAKSLVTAPVRNFRELSRLNTFKANDEEQDERTLWALRDVSFDVAEGEVVGIIGRNGAGKSTLLKVLSRITEPTSGRAVIRGRVSSLLEVGTGFHPELSGRDNIYMNGTILGMTKREIDSKFDEIVDFSGVEKFLDTPIKRYSSGMQVRLAFSVAAHLEPEILIIDEVLAVGDAEFQSKCLGKMQHVAAAGRTVLFVSHNMAAVDNLCTRVLLANKGSIECDGPASKTISAYLQLSSKNANCSDLSDRQRGPGLKAVLKKVSVANARDESVSSLESGQPCKVSIFYEHSENLETPRFGILFESEMGERLFFLQTGVQSEPCPNLSSRGVIECSMRAIPLVPGRYYLTVGCSLRGRQFDLVERAAVVDVVEGNAFGTGRLPHPSNGRLLVWCDWDCDVPPSYATASVD